jgi:hypothetical protein
MTYACNRDHPIKHPHLPIQDVACGYDQRLTDPRCDGCHRSRAESALDQLHALDSGHGVDGYERQGGR